MAKSKTRPAAAATAAASADDAATPERQLTCFVVTGFGEKTDYATGRVLNLDKTFEQLVQPACDAVKINCFRAIDANLTGSIDTIMYRWIYQADLVIADLSTLNPNVFYELGVRHAQRPNTTVIIAESVLVQRIPFDLSAFVVHKYEHGGAGIAEAEQARFVAHLSDVLGKIIAGERRRQAESPQTGQLTDSPIYIFHKGMKPPAYEADTFVEPPLYVPPAERRQRQAAQGESLASIIDAAEAAKNRKDFGEAIRLFTLAIARQTEGRSDPKPDVFLAQRLALVTYKHGERKDPVTGKLDTKVATAALLDAEQILARYCRPKISNDPETLGLSGAINKRLFELSGDAALLDKAIRFYERGFYVKRDYYNGINVAYMYNQRANLQTTRFDAIVDYGHANMIRQLVVEICQALIDDEAAFANRGDREWVLLTQFEALHALGRADDARRLQPLIDKLATDFGREANARQMANLQAAMDQFQRQWRPDLMDAFKAAADAPSPGATAATTAVAAEAAGAVPPAVSEQRFGAVAIGGRRPLTIDPDIAPDRVVKSIEVTCRIEYA